MLNFKVKIGLVPLRRDVTPRPGQFNWEKAEERSLAAIDYIEAHYTGEHAEFVNLKSLNPSGILFSENDVDYVVSLFQKEKVDAIFLIAANFGDEQTAGLLAKKIGKPVLLWGPQDTEFMEDGTRYTDSQCGLFGISKQLQRMKVPFSYIENCHIEDALFDRGFRRFISVACAVKNLYGLRVGQVGLRPKAFCSVIANESQLMELFDIHVIPINLATVQLKFNAIMETRGDEIAKIVEQLRSMYELDEPTEALIDKIAAYVLLYQELFAEFNVGAISSECWSALGTLVGALPCIAYTILADMGYIISCETDTYAAITQVLLRSLSLGKKVPFLGEFTTRHPERRDTELLWHCGQFGYSLRKEGGFCKTINTRANFEVKDGHYTIARIDQIDDKYGILVGECEGGEGPYTNGTYLWGKFKDLDAFERKIIEGPYIHHVSEIEGDYIDAIRDVCKFVPALTFDPVE